ncbi:ATP-binding protein [Halobiforma nitratireducens]|uniref:Putative ATP-binding protein n=1 Tax=Halobiforma nitratireducens JCM 10879 TaxID=1227454 RepID=M0MBC2_9EURY|nr:DUF87 domain-containing protein [Halobiforma nitratireducens]EMA41939.1 putative ATP-binding protein [Halobiforma nitratireducens JCM 10879]
MMGQDDDPVEAELEELQDLMEYVGEDEARIEQVLRVAAVNRGFYNDIRELYEQRKRAERPVRPDEFYPYDDVSGPFYLGETPNGEVVGLTPEQVNEHLLIVGRTGAGKTTMFYNLMEECTTWDLPFMVFDFKNDYRHLATEQDLLVINWRDLKFNPLQPPPGVQPAKWGEVIADTFAHTTDLLIGSESYFLEKLRDLYALYDLTEAADRPRYPSVFELKALVAADEIPKASPRYRYKERVWSRLSMMTGFSAEIFDCSRGYPLEDLLERNVVFELKEPNQHVANFVVEAILTWLYYYRDAQGQRQGLRHVVMFDEAKRVFDVNRERQPESGFPPIDDLMGKVREFGEALIIADHEPSKLTDSVKANTNAKLWLSLGSGKDTAEMARTFGLDSEETDFTRTLEKGEAVLKLADRDPVPLQLPGYPLEKTMTEADIRQRMQPELDPFSYAERVRPDPFLVAIGEQPEDDQEEDEPVGEVAEALLASVAEEPFLSLSERYETIDVVARQGNAAKQELLTLGLIQESEVRTGTPGRNPKLLELTDAGRQALEDRGYDVADTGRRGIEHRYWQQQIKEAFETQGFDAEIEFAVDQRRIDVYAVRGDETVAVEVARSPEHELTNIVKCLEYDVDRVEVAYLDTSVRDRIETAVREEFGEIPARVIFVPVSEYA